jgi:hypothetical protein
VLEYVPERDCVIVASAEVDFLDTTLSDIDTELFAGRASKARDRLDSRGVEPASSRLGDECPSRRPYVEEAPADHPRFNVSPPYASVPATVGKLFQILRAADVLIVPIGVDTFEHIAREIRTKRESAALAFEERCWLKQHALDGSAVADRAVAHVSQTSRDEQQVGFGAVEDSHRVFDVTLASGRR